MVAIAVPAQHDLRRGRGAAPRAAARARGARVLNALIDLPFAVSPVVVGLALILVYGQDGLVRRRGSPTHGDPGDLLDAGDGPRDDLRLAAVRRARGRAGAARDRHRAGAGRRARSARRTWQTFWRVTLPAIRWGVAYGVILTTARALGEFGAVSVVSGKLAGQTETADAARRGPLPGLRPDRRLRGLGRPRRCSPIAVILSMTLPRPQEGDRDPDGHRGRSASPSASATSSPSTTSPSTVPDGSLTALLGPERRRQVDAAARDRRPRGRRTRARCCIDGEADHRRGAAASATSASSSSTTRPSST